MGNSQKKYLASHLLSFIQSAKLKFLLTLTNVNRFGNSVYFQRFIYAGLDLFEVVFVKWVCIWRTSVFFQFCGVLSGVIYNYSPPLFY